MLNNALRQRCMEYILLLLERDALLSPNPDSVQPSSALDKNVSGVEEQVRVRLCDKSEAVRAVARHCFWAFKRLWKWSMSHLSLLLAFVAFNMI